MCDIPMGDPMEPMYNTASIIKAYKCRLYYNDS